MVIYKALVILGIRSHQLYEKAWLCGIGIQFHYTGRARLLVVARFATNATMQDIVVCHVLPKSKKSKVTNQHADPLLGIQMIHSVLQMILLDVPMILLVSLFAVQSSTL